MILFDHLNISVVGTAAVDTTVPAAADMTVPVDTQVVVGSQAEVENTQEAFADKLAVGDTPDAVHTQVVDHTAAVADKQHPAHT